MGDIGTGVHVLTDGLYDYEECNRDACHSCLRILEGTRVAHAGSVWIDDVWAREDESHHIVVEVSSYTGEITAVLKGVS